jgi:uncharacterized protein (TIGR02996 family)
MTREEAFAQAILEAPDDDVARLVYADWLQEQGDARKAVRGQLILVRHECRQLFTDDLRLAEPRSRERELLSTLEIDWRVRYPRFVHDNWSHGFVEKILLPGTLNDLGPGELSPYVRLAADPDFALVRTLGRNLDVPFSPLKAEDLSALLRSPHFKVRELFLFGQYSFNGYVEEFNPFVDLDGVVALAGSPAVASVKRLSLISNGIGDRHAEALLNSPHLTNCTELAISDYPLRGRECFVTPELLRALRDRFGVVI